MNDGLIEIDNEDESLLIQQSVAILGLKSFGLLDRSQQVAVNCVMLTEAETVTPNASCAISKRPLAEVPAFPLGAGAER